MKISVDISMYPLRDDFIPPIDDFLKKLHHVKGLEVVTNVMSTQVFGDSRQVFETLHQLIVETYSTLEQCPFVIKVLHRDISSNTIKDY